MYVGICIKREFWSVTSVYAPGMERPEEERDSFGEELKGCIEACEDRGRILVIEDMNSRMEDCKAECVRGKFGVSGMNENARKLIRARKRK